MRLGAAALLWTRLYTNLIPLWTGLLAQRMNCKLSLQHFWIDNQYLMSTCSRQLVYPHDCRDQEENGVHPNGKEQQAC